MTCPGSVCGSAELERSEENTKKYQEELARTRAMYQGLFEFAPDAIIVVGRGGEIPRINKQAEKLFGYSREELLLTKLRCFCRNASGLYIESTAAIHV